MAVCDDHPLVLEGLCSVIALDSALELVGTASDGDSAVALAVSAVPDVFLLDLLMPRVSGFDAAERIRKEQPGVRIVALTAHEEPGWVDRAMRLGLSGYILKRSSLRQLLEAIKLVASGGVYFDPLLVDHVINANLMGGALPSSAQLTDREQAVAIRLAKGFTNKEIATALTISVKTVESHRANLLRKLGLHHRADLVRYAYQRGWLDDL